MFDADVNLYDWPGAEHSLILFQPVGVKDAQQANRSFRGNGSMLGQSDVTEARMINQALVESSPWDGVNEVRMSTLVDECIETSPAAKRTRYRDCLRD